MLSLALAAFIAILDQWTKWWVRRNLPYGEPQVIIPGWFNLTYIRNAGAAWGMLGGQNMFLIILSVVFLTILVVFRRSLLEPRWSHRVALGLMVGGIVGNLLDRARLGWVTDFLDFHVGSWHWPAFNVADAAICIGVAIYAWATLRSAPTASPKPT